MKFSKYSSNELLEVYSKSRDNYEYEDFALGYIVKDFKDYFIFKTIDEYGNLDSYTLMVKDDISKIASNTKYADAFSFYIAYNKSHGVFDMYNLTSSINDLVSDELINIINVCCQREKILNVYTNDNEVYHGNIIVFDNQTIAINESQYYQQFTDVKESNQHVRLEQITAIDLLNKENFLYEQFLKRKY